jgi:hypothetical protein
LISVSYTGFAYLKQPKIINKGNQSVSKICGTFSPEEKQTFIVEYLLGLIGIRARLLTSLDITSTNKERIEQLEDGLHRMELGMAVCKPGASKPRQPTT